MDAKNNIITITDDGYLCIEDEKIHMHSGNAIIMLTDRFLVTSYPFGSEISEEYLWEKLLELRLFDLDKEYKLFRGSVNKDISWRLLRDEKDVDSYDDEQYLDVDEKRTKDCDRVCATGGGYYSLPLSDYSNAKLRLRNYVRYDESTGQGYISDWRILEFVNEEV